jgi:rhodanese-related sulfurtransferase
LRPRVVHVKLMNITTITPTELAKLCDQGGAIDLIDVRTPVEFREVHAVPARNVPLDQLDPAAVMRARQEEMGTGSEPHPVSHATGASGEVPVPISSGRPLYVICRSGKRGQQACEKFAAAGFTGVVNVEGGTEAWAAHCLPVVRGKKAVSLERQVRIAAGSLVCVGALLGWLIHPACFALSAAVGAGLIFAGVTDTCGMGLLLARMPWNRTC